MTAGTPVQIRFDADLLAEIDAYTREIRVANPEKAWGRSEVIRELVKAGLETVRKPRRRPRKGS